MEQHYLESLCSPKYSAFQFCHVPWLPDKFWTGLPTYTRGYSVSCWHVTKETCNPPCRVATCCVDNTGHFYWGLKLHWPNKWPGKKLLSSKLTLFAHIQAGYMWDRDRGLGKKKEKGRDRKGVREGLSYLHLTYVYVSIYGMWNVATSSQKPAFPIQLPKGKTHMSITSFVCPVNTLPAKSKTWNDLVWAWCVYNYCAMTQN